MCSTLHKPPLVQHQAVAIKVVTLGGGGKLILDTFKTEVPFAEKRAALHLGYQSRAGVKESARFGRDPWVWGTTLMAQKCPGWRAGS